MLRKKSCSNERRHCFRTKQKLNIIDSLIRKRWLNFVTLLENRNTLKIKQWDRFVALIASIRWFWCKLITYRRKKVSLRVYRNNSAARIKIFPIKWTNSLIRKLIWSCKKIKWIFIDLK